MGDIFEQLLADTKPRTQVATVCVDGGLHVRVNELTRVLFEEKQADLGDMAGSAAGRELEELLSQAEKVTYDFRFASVGADRWQRLKDRHAPDKNKAKALRDRSQQVPEFLDSFWPEAICASLEAVKKAVDGEDGWQPADWNEDKLSEVTKRWNAAQWAELREGCRMANEQGNALPKADSASVQTLIYGASSERREQSDGPDRSSMAGD